MAKVKNKGKSKEEIAYNYLWKMICSDQYDVGDLLPTEMEIADELKINRLTVSKALAWLKKEGYINRKAGFGTLVNRKPPSSNSRLILVISPWPQEKKTANWYYSRLLYAIHSEAILNGATTIHVAFQNDEAKEENFNRIRDIFTAVRCEGALVIDPYMSTNDRLKNFLDTLNCPSVWAGSSLNDDTQHQVDVDNYQAAYDLTEKLIGDGFKKIGFFGGSLNTTARIQRYEGHKASLIANQLEFDERYVVCTNTNSYMEELGNECAGLYSARRLDADALFINDATMVHGIHEFCQQFPNEKTKHLKNLPIGTFDSDHKDIFQQIRYSVIQPVEEIGYEAVKVFLEELSKSSGPVIKKLGVEIKHFPVK